MKLNEFDLNKSIKEDNNFSEFKPFKAENYFPNERHDYSKDFKVNESFEKDIDINSDKHNHNVSNNANNKEQLKEIAEIKLPDLNAYTVEAAMKIVAGTARNMGVKIEGE